jgi:hypothetical protein
MALPAEIAALVAKREAPCAFLVRFHFVSGIVRVWTGFGPLRTLDGQIWSGLGELGTIDGLTTAFNGTAPAGRLTVSGVDAGLMSVAVGETDDFEGQPVGIFLQAFDGRALSGMPCAIAVRLMMSLEVSRSVGNRTLSITHETPYTGRNRPAGGFYSDRDQQKRWPGDSFCERTPLLLFASRRWPDY